MIPYNIKMQFKYQGPRLRGAETLFQQWQITPQSSNQYWGPNDVIKLMGNIDQGLIDFYRSHIQFEVQVTPQMQPVGLIQIDNSAQSLIAQTVLLSNQREIQRIQQYDVLAAILTDINYVQYVCQSRSGQGLGYSNIGTSLPLQNSTSSVGATDISSWMNQVTSGINPIRATQSYGGFSPTGCATIGAGGSVGAATYTLVDIDAASEIQFSSLMLGGTAGGAPQSISNWLAFNNSTFTTTAASQLVKANGRAYAIRSQYGIGPLTCGYPDAPYSLPLTAPKVANQKWSLAGMKTEGFNPNNPYTTYYSPADPATMTSSSKYSLYASTNCAATGYIKPVGSSFSVGTNQPYLSATIPQCQMANGKILPQPIPISRKTFRMPLISAILGILIPPDQFQLIPAASLKNIILQISLNPYAFFTSGYSDIHQADMHGMQTINMQKRQWNITKFNWTWHLYTFQDKQITKSLQTKLTSGIFMSSNYWQCSAQYQLQNGSYVRNTFQIPVNCESLAQVDIVFLSNEYQTKTFCRKQFRLSNNITSMQFKANGSYYPLQPVLGNAGNPQTIDSTGDNWEFYQLLLLANNYFINMNAPMPKINTKNFAINGRIYNTLNKATFMPQSTIHNGGVYPQSASSTVQKYKDALQSLNNINGDTAMGQAWFHQNRYVGKAVYCYTFQPYGHSKGTILGLDTRGYRQFDVTFNTLPTDVFPTDETMLIFTRSNIVVKFSLDGIQVMGV